MNKLKALVINHNLLGVIIKRCVKEFDDRIDFTKAIEQIEHADRYETQQIRGQFNQCMLGNDEVTVELMLTVTKKNKYSCEIE